MPAHPFLLNKPKRMEQAFLIGVLSFSVVEDAPPLAPVVPLMPYDAGIVVVFALVTLICFKVNWTSTAFPISAVSGIVRLVIAIEEYTFELVIKDTTCPEKYRFSSWLSVLCSRPLLRPSSLFHVTGVSEMNAVTFNWYGFLRIASLT